MPKVVDVCLPEIALLPFNKYGISTEKTKQLLKISTMLISCPRIYDYIIKVYQYILAHKLPKHLIHKVLEFSRNVSEPKVHH